MKTVKQRAMAAVLLSAAMLLPTEMLPAGISLPRVSALTVQAETDADNVQPADEITATTTDVTQTTTDITATTTVTTQAAAQPVLRLEPVMTDGFPSGDTELHVYVQGNPGLEALGISLTLPDILTPDVHADGTVDFAATDALNDAAYAYYVPETHTLSLAYAAAEAGAAKEDLGCFLLHISEDAVIGEQYPITLSMDSISADGIREADWDALTYFSPTEPLLRTLSETKLTLTEQGGSYPLTLSPEPSAGSCEWSSSDTDVVTVDANGNLSALANGNAVITVTCETRTYTCDVTVRIDRQLAQSQLTVDTLDGTVQLALVPEPMHEVVWHSENETVVAVSETGLATVKVCGTAEIVAVVEETEYRFSVTTVITRALNYTEYTFTDLEEKLSLTLSPASYSAAFWISDNTEVARVTSGGVVYPLGNGTATVIVTCEGYDFTCKITVDVPTCLNYDSYAATEIGETVQLELIPAPVWGNDPPVWHSSDAAVASVDETGLVTCLSYGSAEITAEYMGKSYVCAVVVQSYVLGDVNDDGVIDARDAMLALIAYANVTSGLESPLTAVQKRAADINKNDDVSLNDAMAILRYYAARLSGFTPGWDELI